MARRSVFSVQQMAALRRALRVIVETHPTMTDAAEALGCDDSHLSHVLAGRRGVSRALAERIAADLRLTLDELLTRHAEPTPRLDLSDAVRLEMRDLRRRIEALLPLLRAVEEG